jgi:hypothetical protein
MELKQQMLKVIEELPDDAGVEEALDRLYLLYKVQKGLRQADRGEMLTQEEVRSRFDSRRGVILGGERRSKSSRCRR